jgi:ferritin-like protein
VVIPPGISEKEGINVQHFVKYQVQMLASEVPRCLLAGWDVGGCTNVSVPYDEAWCRQMVCILASIIIACSAKGTLATDKNVIEGHREFCVYTKKLASECSDKYRIKGKEF